MTSTTTGSRSSARRRLPRTAAAIIGVGATVAASTGVVTASASAQTDLATAALTAQSAPACTPGTTVRTRKGRVCGTTSDKVTSYTDIPYAAAPVGRLRWRAPQPHRRWRGTLRATKPLPFCPNPATPAAQSTENCLYLEVKTPANVRPGEKLPVVYEFHGGGFIIEGRTDQGQYMVRSGHVVYVYVSYRMGILGFLANKSLGAHSGDYGLQDEQAGLRWVKRNITRFGGNPRNVTVIGESAGGASVCAAVASPTAKGLFQRGISVSGFYNYNRIRVWSKADCKSKYYTEKQAQRAGAKFAQKVGCGHTAHVARCLRTVPADELVKAGGKIAAPFAGGTIGPIVNGTTLTMSPGKALATGHDNHVPLIFDVGANEFNGGEVVNIPGRHDIVANTPAQYRRLLRLQFGPATTRAIERLYPLSSYPKPAPYLAYRDVMADAFTVCPSLVTAEWTARHMPVYLSVSNDFGFLGVAGSGYPNKTVPIGAFHSTTNVLDHSDPALLNPNQRVLDRQLLSVRAAFAHTASPNTTGVPTWRLFSRGSHPVMTWAESANSRVVSARLVSTVHNCGFWNKVDPQFGNHPWWTGSTR